MGGLLLVRIFSNGVDRETLISGSPTRGNNSSETPGAFPVLNSTPVASVICKGSIFSAAKMGALSPGRPDNNASKLKKDFISKVH
jgi:hypothetical protein